MVHGELALYKKYKFHSMHSFLFCKPMFIWYESLYKYTQYTWRLFGTGI